MSVGKNASYQSRASVQEFQESISEVLESELLNKIRKAEFFSILCDESTDISNTKKLILYVRLIDPDTFVASTHFLGNITVEELQYRCHFLRPGGSGDRKCASVAYHYVAVHTAAIAIFVCSLSEI